jgi:rubredoxin
MGEMFHYTLYCPNCRKQTLQHLWESGHDRDASGDWRECSVCHWRYSGLTGRWEAAREDPRK